VEVDVRDADAIGSFIASHAPGVIFHLAGAKHAPVGEIDPHDSLWTNTLGTYNVVEAAKKTGARVVLASTCKAINPETAYGASKLLAERITLNYENGTVARFHNIVETQGKRLRLLGERLGWFRHVALRKLPSYGLLALFPDQG